MFCLSGCPALAHHHPHNYWHSMFGLGTNIVDAMLRSRGGIFADLFDEPEWGEPDEWGGHQGAAGNGKESAPQLAINKLRSRAVSCGGNSFHCFVFSVS